MQQEKTEPRKPRWAPRIPQEKVRRLYENDAKGIFDEVLIDDVGIGLYLRCKSILTVSKIYDEGRLPCPECGSLCSLPPDPQVVRCESCGWEIAWENYRATFRHQELGAGGAGEYFAGFIGKWEVATTPRERLLLIDRLIHLWHWETRQEDHILGRPTGVNLIEGSRKQVIELLNNLTYGDNSAPETALTRDSWRSHRDQVRASQDEWAKSAQDRRAHRRENPRDGD